MSRAQLPASVSSLMDAAQSALRSIAEEEELPGTSMYAWRLIKVPEANTHTTYLRWRSGDDAWRSIQFSVTEARVWKHLIPLKGAVARTEIDAQIGSATRYLEFERTNNILKADIADYMLHLPALLRHAYDTIAQLDESEFLTFGHPRRAKLTERIKHAIEVKTWSYWA
jgi:hypothetical protein